jgi:hypothetical protein
MTKSQQAKLKQQIVSLIRQNGRPVVTQYIADHITLPEHIALSDLLTELVAEQRLHRSFTLLPNGDPDCTYI